MFGGENMKTEELAGLLSPKLVSDLQKAIEEYEEKEEIIEKQIDEIEEEMDRIEREDEKYDVGLYTMNDNWLRLRDKREMLEMKKEEEFGKLVCETLPKIFEKYFGKENIDESGGDAGVTWWQFEKVRVYLYTIGEGWDFLFYDKDGEKLLKEVVL